MKKKVIIILWVFYLGLTAGISQDKLEIGLLLNFGATSLEIKRLLNKKMSEPGFS